MTLLTRSTSARRSLFPPHSGGLDQRSKTGAEDRECFIKELSAFFDLRLITATIRRLHSKQLSLMKISDLDNQGLTSGAFSH